MLLTICFSDEKVITTEPPLIRRMIGSMHQSASIAAMLNIYEVAHGFGCSVEDGRCRAFVHWTRRKSRWRVLSIGMSFYRNKCYLLSDMLQVRTLSFSRTVHQHIRHMTQSNCCGVKVWNSWLFLRSYGHPTAWTWTLLSTRFGVSYRTVSMRHGSTMWMNSGSDWLTSGVVCSTALSTLPSVSGESVCRPEFAQREDILNIWCRQFRQLKENVNRHFVNSVF